MMSGWRLAMAGVAPVCGALFFLKLIADSVASTGADIKLLELAKKKAWMKRREQAARKAQESPKST